MVIVIRESWTSKVFVLLTVCLLFRSEAILDVVELCLECLDVGGNWKINVVVRIWEVIGPCN